MTIAGGGMVPSARPRIHELGMTPREFPQRRLGKSPIRVGAAEAPRPRTQVSGADGELQILIERGGRRCGAGRALFRRIARKLPEHYRFRYAERCCRHAEAIRVA